MKKIDYQYKHLPIPGGGYVTGFAFHQEVPNVLYARTDIGGVYRYLYEEQKWKSLIEHVTEEDLSESFPIAIALDVNKPERLLIACGENQPQKGVLAISDNYGESFIYEKIPVLVHGNLNGRGTGNRLIVDSRDSHTLYFASQQEGLLRSRDLGKTWEKLNVNGEQYMTFVWQSPNGKTLIVGTAGVTTAYIDETSGMKVRGKSLYVSYDEGNHFEPLVGPKAEVLSKSRFPGDVAQRYDFDGKYFYVTLSNTGEHSYVVENGYSCDSGDAIGGKVIRYTLDEEQKVVGYKEITPRVIIEKDKKESDLHIDRASILDYGFSGISSCKAMPGLLVCSTICCKIEGKDADYLYLSYDYGETWEVALYDLKIGNLSFKTSYMKPQYNGGQSIVHWMSDVKINPFNPEELWFNSGTGVFQSEYLTSRERSFHDQCEGIEETVHLNLYSPPAGEVKLIDILGDLGGFAFKDLDMPCENSFADAEGNRYITCINADYSDDNPNHVIVTPRGNWTGKTKGGLIVSKDQCQTFTRLEMPFGINEEIDKKLKEIENPNVNSGWVAMSPDGKNIVWSMASEWVALPIALVVYSHDGGKRFNQTQVYNRYDERIKEGYMKVFSDRKHNHLMYGFGEDSKIYISHDGGATFKQYEVPKDFPKVHFGLIDCANLVEVRADAGRSGIFYMALGEYGLWKMIYNEQEDKIRFIKLSEEHQRIDHVGLGVLKQGGTYLGEDKALYVYGKIEGQYGFYASFDDGQTWQILNTEQQMFGDINSIEGDSRCFGRFFIATGSLGVLYGEPRM